MRCNDQTDNGQFEAGTYRINLAIIESLIKRRDVMIPMVDETRYNAVLNKDGRIENADRMANGIK